MDAYEAMGQLIRLLNHDQPASEPVGDNLGVDWTPQNVSAFSGPVGTYGNSGFGGNGVQRRLRQSLGVKAAS